MAIINQSTVALILIISYSVGLDLFRRSKIDNIYTCLINKKIQRIYTVNKFTITNLFNCNVFNIANVNVFVMFCVDFEQV